MVPARIGHQSLQEMRILSSRADAFLHPFLIQMFVAAGFNSFTKSVNNNSNPGQCNEDNVGPYPEIEINNINTQRKQKSVPS